MSKPFNFYQQISGLIFPEGSPTPFGLFYINESGIFGVYFPQNVALGAPLHLLNDGDSSPASFTIKQYGKVDRELKDAYKYSIGPSGNLYPAPPDFSNYYMVMNGAVTGDTPDNFSFSIPVSGNLDSIPLDIPLFSIAQKGAVVLCPLDTPLLQSYFYGNVLNFQNDVNKLTVAINGKVRKKQQDEAALSFVMEEISFTPGIEEISINTSDSAGISFIINTISFNRA